MSAAILNCSQLRKPGSRRTDGVSLCFPFVNLFLCLLVAKGTQRLQPPTGVSTSVFWNNRLSFQLERWHLPHLGKTPCLAPSKLLVPLVPGDQVPSSILARPSRPRQLELDRGFLTEGRVSSSPLSWQGHPFLGCTVPHLTSMPLNSLT
jgi:hypothetical protein